MIDIKVFLLLQLSIFWWRTWFSMVGNIICCDPSRNTFCSSFHSVTLTITWTIVCLIFPIHRRRSTVTALSISGRVFVSLLSRAFLHPKGKSSTFRVPLGSHFSKINSFHLCWIYEVLNIYLNIFLRDME